MRKAILFVSVVLLLLATLGPLATGIVAERQFQENLALLSASPEATELGLVPLQEVYDRGWFTTVGRTRVVVVEGPILRLIRRYTGGGEFADEPAFVLANVIHHGPLTGLVRPGLARIESALFLDGLAPQPVEIPLLLETLVGLDGRTDMQLRMHDGDLRGAQRSATWQQAEGHVEFTNRGLLGGFGIGAAALAVGLQDRALRVSLSAPRIDADLEPPAAAAELPTGAWRFTVAEATVSRSDATAGPDGAGTAADPPLLRVRDGRIAADARRADGKLDTTIDIGLPAVTDELGKTISLTGTVRVDGLDAAALNELRAAASERTLRRSQLRFRLGALPDAGDPRTAAIDADFARRTNPALRALIAGGGDTEWDLSVGTPHGDVGLRFALTMPPGDVAPGADPAAAAETALRASAATLNLRVPGAVADNTIAAYPPARQQFDALRGMGLVVRDGGDYVMNAVYEGGLLSLNGTPIPLGSSPSP